VIPRSSYELWRRQTLAQEAGIELIVIKLEEAKKAFVLLPSRWVGGL
jgi:hypothetical protein